MKLIDVTPEAISERKAKIAARMDRRAQAHAHDPEWEALQKFWLASPRPRKHLLSWADDQNLADASLLRYQVKHPAQQAALNQVRLWCEAVYAEKPRAVVLWGNNGTGKSHLCAGAWGALSFPFYDEQTKEVSAFLNIAAFPYPHTLTAWVKNIYDEIKRAEEGNKPKPLSAEAQLTEILRNCDAVILDDLAGDAVINVVWANGIYTLLVDTCLALRKGLLISTNLNPVQLQQHIGARAYSRLGDLMPNSDQWVNMSALPDWRLTEKNSN